LSLNKEVDLGDEERIPPERDRTYRIGDSLRCPPEDLTDDEQRDLKARLDESYRRLRDERDERSGQGPVVMPDGEKPK
jgi:hypothetical protein